MDTVLEQFLIMQIQYALVFSLFNWKNSVPSIATTIRALLFN